MGTPPGVAPGQVAALTRLNTADALRAVGLENAPRWVRAAAAWPLWPPARSLARRLVAFDAAIGIHGLPAASRDLLADLGPGIAVSGSVPATGGVLVIANHPGLFDALALFGALPRDDVHLIALDRPVLRALPGLRARSVPVPESGARAGVVRRAARLLAEGRVVVTFPAGRIEPDPGVRPGAAAAVDAWSGSVALFARLVPGLVIVPAALAHAHTARGLEHPLTRLRRDADDRDWLGAVLQLLVPALRTKAVSVRFGEPTPDAAAALAAARRLLAEASAQAPSARGGW